MASDAKTESMVTSTVNGWTLEHRKHAIEILSTLFTMCAAVVSGLWIYKTYLEAKEPRTEVTVVCDPKFANLGDGMVMIVNVTMRNRGNERLYPGKNSYGEGLELSVIEYDELNPVINEPDKLIIDWDSVDGKYKLLASKYNMLSGYDSYRRGSYNLRAGEDARETVAVRVQRGKLYALRARLFTTDWTTADYKYAVAEQTTSETKN